MDTNKVNVWESVDMAGSLISASVHLNNVDHMSAHVFWTGTPTGDLYLEISNNNIDWAEVATTAVSGAGNQMWLDRNTPYAFFRLRYEPTASTGTISAISITKGDD